MKAIRKLGLLVPLTLLACATAVTQDLSEPEDEGQGSSGGTDGVIPTGGKSNEGGKAGSNSPTSGTGPQAFGGASTSGGTGSNEAGEGSGGDAGSGTSGGTTGGAGDGGTGGSSSAGTTSGGSTASGGTGGGSAGAGGKASGGTGGSGGSGSGGAPVGTGDCSGTPLFMAGAGTKYALNAKVVATCNGGTPCTQAQPPLQQGKAYEFNCIDQYNCGSVDPATTNWAIPPWTVVRACE